MGTNFYLVDKKPHSFINDIIFALDDKDYWTARDLIDEQIKSDKGMHIAKTSCGWLPLFEQHKEFASVRDLKSLYDTGNYIIRDEYDSEYTWDQFNDRVLKFNGGVYGAIPQTPVDISNIPTYLVDKNMPSHTPISHFEYGNGMYAKDYYTDEDGYEWTCHEFS